LGDVNGRIRRSYQMKAFPCSSSKTVIFFLKWVGLWCGQQQIGRVLRIRKVSSHDSKPKPSTAAEKAQKPILSEDEQKLWREWPAMADATTPAAMAHIYASSIIQPLLGQEHVDAGVYWHSFTFVSFVSWSLEVSVLQLLQ
jgi:hypothetical protein